MTANPNKNFSFQFRLPTFDVVRRGSPWEEKMTKFLMMFFQAGIGRAHMSDNFKQPSSDQRQNDSEFVSAMRS